VNSRRKLVIALGASALAAPYGSFAQQPGKVWRVGVLGARSGPDKLIEAFREQLRTLGYVEGRNVVLEYRWSPGKEERLVELATELVHLNVDVLVTISTVATVAAKRATSNIPIVMASVPDPIGNKLIASLARPGGNVTGLSTQSSDLAAKRLQLLRDFVPKANRVAILAALEGAPAFPLYLEQLQLAAKKMGVTLVVKQVETAEALADIFDAMQRERAQALIVQLSHFTVEHAKRIVELALQHRLPLMFEAREFVDIGALISYGPDRSDVYRRAATYVDKILKGAKPADLPVEQPTKFELFINGKTAKTLGLKIPQSLLASADKVIE